LRRNGFARRDLQVVFQNSLGSVNPRLTAGDIVAEPLDNFERPSLAARRPGWPSFWRWLAFAGRRGQYPHQFSGGQLQRVCIARALAPRPKVVILDEAVSSLDMLVQAKILDLLAALRRETGASYLFISHDVRVVLRLCDRVAVLHQGAMVESPAGVERIGDFTHPAFLALVDSLLPATPPTRAA
jgi:nickel transport system ATP-binding protein